MNKFFTVTSLLSFSVLSTFAQSGGSWSKKADVGTSNRESAVGFTINNKGYIGLGIVGGSPNGAMWEYDPATGVWTQKANMLGGGRVNAVAFAFSSRAFVGMGEDISFNLNKKFYEFSPAANVWVAAPDFGGTGRTEAVAFSIGLKGYVGTGWDGTRRKDFWEYDLLTSTWTQKADFGGTARNRAVGFSINDKGYIGTGNDGTLKKDFWEYNPTTNAWAQKSDLPGGARESAVGFAIQSKGYITTGDGGTGKNDIWEYNPLQDEWIQRASFIGDRRYVAAGFSYSNKGYIGTGFTDAPATGVNTRDFYEFTAPAAPNPPTNAMVTRFSENSIRVHWYDNSTDETGFTVERSTNGTTFTTLTTLAANTTSYTDNGLSTGQTYYYRVRATKTSDGVSAATNIASQMTGANKNGVWTQLADNYSTNPFVGDGASTFTLDNKVYITGGPDGSGNLTKNLWEYNPATTIYTQKAVFPGEARRDGIAFALGGKGYFGTGAKGSGVANMLKDFWQYDAVLNEWSQKADVGTVGRVSAFNFVAGAKGYVGAGVLASTGTTGKDVYEYDPATDVWTPKTDIPYATSGRTAVGLNNKGYVNLGSVIYEFDPLANTWALKGRFPIASYGYSGLTVIRDRIFASAYTYTSTPYQSTLWEFEVLKGRWIERAMFAEGNQYSGLVTATANDLLFAYYQGSSYVYTLDFELKKPTGLTAEVIDPRKIKLTWQVGTEAANVQIARAESEAGPYSVIAQIPSDQKVYLDSDFDGVNKTAFYKVRAINGSLESDYTKTVAAGKRGAWKKVNRIANATSEMFGDVAIATSSRGYMGISLNSQTWWEFNPADDTWTQKANFPGVARTNPVAFSIGEKIYAGLGYEYGYGTDAHKLYKDFYQYDASSNTWTKKNDFTGAGRMYSSYTSSADKGYMIGGDDGTGAVTFLNEAWEYNPATDTWLELAKTPLGTAFTATFVQGGKLFFMNGSRRFSATSYGSILQAYSLDLSTNNTWTKELNPSYDAAGTVYQINGTAYFDIRGMNSYNFANKTWTLKPFFPATGYYSSRTFSLNGKIYAVTTSYDVWVYDPQSLVAPPENLDSKLLGDRIELSWLNVSTLPVRTKIQYTTGSGYFQDLTTVSAGATSYVYTEALPDNNYKFRVMAVNENGEESVPSGVVHENSGPYWSDISNVPNTRRQEAISFVVDSKLYFGTGRTESTYFKDLWEYDPSTGVWTQKADLPGTARSEATAFVLATDAYVGFGRNSGGPLSDLYKYSAATNSWVASSNNGNPVSGSGVFVDGGNAYFIGGFRNVTGTTNELWRFDGLTWTPLASLPGETRQNPITFAVNGKVYVGGGVKVTNTSTTTGAKDFWEYTIATNEWKQLLNLPDNLRADTRSFAITGSNKAMVFVGSNGSGGSDGDGIKVHSYSVETGKWTLAGRPLYAEYLATSFTAAQDATTGFAYLIVSHGQFGYKLWRYNNLIDGPTLVEAKVTVTGNAVLKWRKIRPQPDSVVVFRSELPNVLGIRQSVVKSSDTTANNAVTSGRTYYYKVRAYSNGGQYKTSAERILVVDNPPSAPIELTGEVGGGQVFLTWQPGAGATPTSYSVERSITNGDDFVSIGNVTTTTLTTSDILAATMYYRVKAINSGGQSAYSNVATVMVTGIEEEQRIGVYPNPTADFLTIEVAPQDGTVNMQLLDYNGRKVFAQELSTTTRIDMTSYPAGIYFVNLISTKRASNKYIKIIKK